MNFCLSFHRGVLAYIPYNHRGEISYLLKIDSKTSYFAESRETTMYLPCIYNVTLNGDSYVNSTSETEQSG